MYARKAELFHRPIVPDCGSSNPAFAATLLLLLLTGTIFSYFCMSSISSVLILAILIALVLF